MKNSLTTGGYLHNFKGLEHVQIVEKVLQRKLSKGVEVHHVDGNRANNEKVNLVVCQDRKYHRLLHIRTKALDACGNANYRKCKYCKKYDDPMNLFIRDYDSCSVVYHNSCNTLYYQIKRSEN